MNKRVLIVDDELNLLRSLQRNLRGKFDLTMAEGGVAGMTQILEGGPFAAIVSDLRMPEIDGLQVLGLARLVVPDTFRVMLTGNVSSHLSLQGSISKPWFQYVSKPCTTESLCTVLNEGTDRYAMASSARRPHSLTTTENSLTTTESGSPQISGTSREAVERCRRLRELARRLGDFLNLNETWQYELAGMLSQLSRLVPVAVSEQREQNNDHDEVNLRNQAESSSRIIREIPRLEQIADMVGHQYTEEFEPTVPDCIRKGTQILRMLMDFDVLTETFSEVEAIDKMKERSEWYGEPLFLSFSELISEEPRRRSNVPFHPHKLEAFRVSCSITK